MTQDYQLSQQQQQQITQALRAFRRIYSLSPAQAAALFNVSERTWHHWEHSTRHPHPIRLYLIYTDPSAPTHMRALALTVLRIMFPKLSLNIID